MGARFDVFLSHNSKDKPVVRTLRDALQQHRISVWFDETKLPGGAEWQKEIEEGIRTSGCGIVAIGKSGISRWQRKEMDVLVALAVEEDKRVIPVLLPGAEGLDGLPRFLSSYTCVDLRKGLSGTELEKLIHGIKGQEPEQSPGSVSSVPPVISPTRLTHGAEVLFGREQELADLEAAWAEPGTHVVTLVAWGGVGKTSLIIDWMTRMSHDGWRGAERVFDWSFYSQGTREQGEASADPFITEALKFFGDPEMAASPAPPWDKGARLAQLVAARRTLLVLDGLEPLQYPPSSATPGKLKDQAVEALLKGLAQQNPGLCIVTTREHVADLGPFNRTAAPERHLEHLSEEAGAALLRQAKVKGTEKELQEASREVDGHALTLSLLGSFLARAHGGDIRKRDLVDFQEADAKVQGGHAFRVMSAYETWLARSGEEGQRQLAILRLLGFFDRPADPRCLASLCAPPAIPGLTEPLADLSDIDWNLAVTALAEAGLVKTADYAPRKVRGYGKEAESKSLIGMPLGAPEDFDPARPHGLRGEVLDAHPLLREHFGAQVRCGHLEAWKEGHRRVYEYLKASVPYWPEGAEGLQPLYQAVAHGCQAGLYQDACDDVFCGRIQRGTRGAQAFYSINMLGLIGANLGAVTCFFEQSWTRVTASLPEVFQGWLLNEAARCLRALGRLREALDPIRAGMEMVVRSEDWKNAAVGASNLSELELTLGDIAAALRDGEQCLDFAERSKGAFQRVVNRTTLADALHQVGRCAEAMERFEEAEAMQAKEQPRFLLLYSLGGFRYCDLLLADAERAAWQCSIVEKSGRGRNRDVNVRRLARCGEVVERATQTLEWVTAHMSLLTIALDHLTLGRAALYRAILASKATERATALQTAREQISEAVTGLRRAGQQADLPHGLLMRAWLRHVEGDAEGARADLEEAWEIAERGSMRLHMADIQLYRARLFHDKAALAEARKLIDVCGYHRRDPELADAEEAAKGW